MELSARTALLLLLLSAIDIARAQDEQTVEPDKASAPASHDPWLDRTQKFIYRRVWRTAMRVDRMFGADAPDTEYEKASGSVIPALLYDEFDGFKPRMRFRVNLPLPQLNERFDAFLGRVNRDEFVTERAPQSGALRRQYGPLEEDQTLFGISYRERPEQGGHWDLGAGVRVRFPLDPYVKGSYVYQRGAMDSLLFTLRETGFWQNSENLGLTSRMDLERIFAERWLVRWTGSATVSQETQGMRGYSAFTVLRGFPPYRAVAAELGLHGETEAEVPLRDYGLKIAYRQTLYREWLVLELRTSVTWPKDEPLQPRKPSWGVGVGFEMMFGKEDFLARPVTF